MVLTLLPRFLSVPPPTSRLSYLLASLHFRPLTEHEAAVYQVCRHLILFLHQWSFPHFVTVSWGFSALGWTWHSPDCISSINKPKEKPALSTKTLIYKTVCIETWEKKQQVPKSLAKLQETTSKYLWSLLVSYQEKLIKSTQNLKSSSKVELKFKLFSYLSQSGRYASLFLKHFWRN